MIEKYLLIANNYIAAHPHYGLIFAFLVAFAESLPILGTLIPGSITMTLIGILVGRNLMPLGLTLLLGFIGAIIGDAIGFAIGKRYKGRLHTVWPFRKYGKLLKLLILGEAFFQKHGGKSIIIGRFIGPTRSSVPLIAGLLRMRWTNFMVAAIPSAFLWALLYLLPGVLIGAISLSLPKDQAATFTAIGLGIIVFVWLLFWAIQRFFIFIIAYLNRILHRGWDWLHKSSSLFSRLLINKNNPKDHHQLTLVFLAVVSGFLFIYLFFCVRGHFGLYELNEPVFYFLQSIRSPHADAFFVAMTELGGSTIMFTAAALLAVVLIMRKEWRTLRHLLVLMLLLGGALWILKHVYFNARPTGFMRIDNSSSFPSGHVTLTCGLVGFLAYLGAGCLKSYWRSLPYLLAGLLMLLVAFSRVYLGAHWLCDVLAGISLALSILLLVIASDRRNRKSIASPAFLLVSILLSLVIPWSIAIIKNFHRDFFQYTTYYPHQMLDIQNWWRFPTAYVPIYRVNRLGKPIQPLNVQWAGDLNQIQVDLEKTGWIPIKTHKNLQATLQRFASKDPEQHLSFLPQLYRQKPPALFMIKRPGTKKGILELRLWDSGINFTNNTLSLYVGSVNYHKPARSYISLRPSLQITLRHGGGMYQLAKDMATIYETKNPRVVDGLLPKKILMLEWGRTILLIRPKEKY